MEHITLFIGALVTVYLVPGPDMLLVLQTSCIQGRAQALATALGLALARIAHVTLAALGLTTLLHAAPWTYDLLRWVGGAYLAWLGIRLFLGGLHPDTTQAPAINRRRPWRTAFYRGLLTNVSNPKALVFCSVLLPQFIDPAAGHVAAQFLVLGSLLVAIGLAFDTLYACASAGLGRLVASHRQVRELQRWITSGLLIGFGTRLALSDG